MDASVAPAFCHSAFPAALLRRRQHALLACCLRSLCLLLCLLVCLLVFCPAEAEAEENLPPVPPAPSLSLELEQLDLSGLPGLPPLPAEDEVLPAAATQALPLPDEAPAADASAEADAALPEAPRWNALEEGLEYAEFSLQSEAGQQASLTVLRIDPELFDFRLYASAAHKHPALTLGQWADSHDLVAAINASMYLPDGVTSTGYMRQDDYINNKRLVRRFGAFFVAGPRQEGLPRADILTREDPQWQELLEQYRLVIQNYRMINDERRILWSPGGPLYAISAVAEDGAGKILFLHCREPLEAYSFAHALLHLPLDVRTVMYVEGGMQAGLVIRSPGLHQELRGRHLADFWVTGNVRAQLPNVLGIRRRHAPALPDCPTMLQQTAVPAAPAE
ncbi:phosphodiester glycosidase family protein [Desulfovibrio sp. SGI.133]|uniref:phosphodiester glycosidase family protein n=1 Tax=Desulfovibrio sp. SGI.133 TaxID=3420560 RepID=UPI003D054706